MEVIERDSNGKPRLVKLTTREMSLQMMFENRLCEGMTIEDAVEDLFRKYPSTMKRQTVEFIEYLTS